MSQCSDTEAACFAYVCHVLIERQQLSSVSVLDGRIVMSET